jgi:RNA polymerase sigma-70 factor (ECF subfamily)
MSNLSDSELMRKVMEKKRCALEELYDRYVKLVYSFALRSARNEHAAREIVQLVFTRLWTTESGFDPGKGQFANWILTITRNIAIDYMRKERRHRGAVSIGPEQWEQISDPSRPDPVDIVANESLKEGIRKAYRHLSESQAELIERVYWQGYTLSEVALMNREPLGTVKSRLHQSLKILRRHLLVEREG